MLFVHLLPTNSRIAHPAVPLPPIKTVPSIPIPPPITCAKGDVGVACALDPCSVSKCKPQPNYVCVPNYCAKPTTYLGNPIPGSGCDAVWIDTTTNKTVPCPRPVGVCCTLHDRCDNALVVAAV
jgi:hypothetical protein